MYVYIFIGMYGYVYSYVCMYIRGAYDKFADFFRIGTLIDSTHMKLESPFK